MKRTTTIAAGACAAAVTALIAGGMMQANAAETTPASVTRPAPAASPATQVEAKTFAGLARPRDGQTLTQLRFEATEYAYISMARYESVRTDPAVCYVLTTTGRNIPDGSVSVQLRARCERNAPVNMVFSESDIGNSLQEAQAKAKAAAAAKLAREELVSGRECTEHDTDYVQLGEGNFYLARLYATCVPAS